MYQSPQNNHPRPQTEPASDVVEKRPAIDETSGTWSQSEPLPAGSSPDEGSPSRGLVSDAKSSSSSDKDDLIGKDSLLAVSLVDEVVDRLQGLTVPSDMARAVVDVLEESGGYDHVALLFLDNSTDLLRPLALSSKGYGSDHDKAVETFASTHYLRMGKGVLGWVADKGETVCLGDIRGHHLFSSIREDVRSVLCVRIARGNRTLGAILLESTDVNAYGKLDAIIMETVSKQFSLALDNAYLKNQIKRSGNGSYGEGTDDPDLASEGDQARTRVSEARLRQLVNRGPAVLYLAENTDVRGILHVSPQIEELLGISPDEWTAAEDAWLQSLHPDDRERVRSALSRSRANGRTVINLEYRVMDSEGQLKWFRDTSRLVEDVAGAGQIWQGVLVEITMRREMEETQQEQLDELAELNAALVYQNEELNAFSHTVAHDLQNPLSILVGFAEMLEREYAGVKDELLNQGVQVIAENGRRLQNIIKELLLMAEVRQLDEIDRVPLDMISILEEVRKRLMNLVDDYQATVIVPSEWPTAEGHGPWVEEIWVNYISNAIKYGGDPPHIELGATVLKDDKIRFWVQDDGRGISREEQAQLFRPFARLPHARAQGHGLGLSIVQRIARKLGGQVGLESKNGRGSRFWFTLPAANDRDS